MAFPRCSKRRVGWSFTDNKSKKQKYLARQLVINPMETSIRNTCGRLKFLARDRRIVLRSSSAFDSEFEFLFPSGL